MLLSRLKRGVLAQAHLSVCRRGLSEVASKDAGAYLRADIRMLGNILGGSIKEDDQGVFDSVEKLRALGREWRTPGGHNKSKLDEIVQEVKSYDVKKLHGVSRAFTHFLALANSAENHHRVRRLRDFLVESKSPAALSSKTDSVLGTMRNLIATQNLKPDDMIAALKAQSVELVYTAHPTEVNRRTMLQKHTRIKDILAQFDRTDLLEYERRQLTKHLHVEIDSIWHSDELKRVKPTPADEARSGIAIVENILWHSVPRFLRKLDDILEHEFNTSLPPDFAPLKFASWMGGDRDGNPNVTPEITIQVSMMSRWTAATLFKADCIKLRSLLSFHNASDELKNHTNNAREPYRYVLKDLEARLDSTIEWTSAAIHKISFSGIGSNGRKPLTKTEELMDPLMMMHKSLLQDGKADAASGELSNTIRRVAAFGLSLLPLDIRQESTRHTEALTAITNHLGLGDYSQWNEQQRRDWLTKELASKRPLLPKRPLESFGFSSTVLDTLNTFKVAAELSEGSLGAYVISQCQQASDVMAVALLQQDADVRPLMRVVPLFETLDDLHRSPSVTEALFSNETYRKMINGTQEIMVGYSDSAKDAGRLAASWAQYNAQVAMHDIAEKYHIDVTFFHGKGGTVGRGGNPATYDSILAHPPNTINGRFRVTEQGEMITQNFGQQGIAERTLDLFTAGVLAEKFVVRPQPKKEWCDMMDRLSSSSCAAYRKIVREEPRFVPYFRAATPELELGSLNVGSRPAKRNPKGGVESLRAIPWVFAWTQTRLNLPAWLGVGEALDQELKTNAHVLKDMYANWPWFRTLIDLVEMILSKSESEIAANYDAQLVKDQDSIQLGNELREKLVATSRAVMTVSGHQTLQENNPRLLKSMALRNPYIDPLNVIQAELLRRLRVDGAPVEDEELLRDALLITINGIANGMKNSG